MEKTLLKQGAEAKIYSSTFYGKPCIVKERFAKKYRHPHLDKNLTLKRIKSEIRAIMRCRLNGISVPVVYWVDLENNSIYMEHIQPCESVSEFIKYLETTSSEQTERELKKLAEKIGNVLGHMHKSNIIHGDLTTSNILIKSDSTPAKIVMIDFGLSDIDNSAEDKGVDLYVLERAIISSHPNASGFFEDILSAYKSRNKQESAVVIEKLEEIRLRGRKRTMVG